MIVAKVHNVNNVIDISESLGDMQKKFSSGLLKHKMEPENIVSGEQFKLSAGGNLLSVTVGVNEIKLKRKKVNQISFQTIIELSNVLEFSKNKTKKKGSTLHRNLIGVVKSRINIKMTELQESLKLYMNVKLRNLLMVMFMSRIQQNLSNLQLKKEVLIILMQW